ncbi:hypothetical protein BIU98_02715 [Curtobacterium sp. MMLR14_010]|uniref:TetR/AcrR family transcriptional regulator n=1 Tax=Curtobacterium sp. MMLR14_010 TaxID=1898743 RepID=UPI0008DC6A33|nr:TetR family transcriptional regulator [Curtobacterium sp. MMLR14_010]OII34886.1 hypothetical protein BIU98_02715 [Curtobacterium sp. MMLR14_010]
MVDGRTARSTATKAKLLEAAREEFQRNGLAGGRVDAIADAAETNKRMIYAYFGSKNALFEEVVADNVRRVGAAVEFTPDDLPGYAVRLYDHWMTDTTSLRLFSWRNVELTTAPEFEDATYRQMIAAIEATGVQRAAGMPASHLLAFVFALVLAWAIPAPAFAEPTDVTPASRHESIATAVRNLVAGAGAADQ